MCGFAGYWSTDRRDVSAMQRAVTTMTDAIEHRGPDDSGAWTDSDEGIALGFRRLSILDLSSAGHQPMTSPRAQFHVLFNGEIYNHGALRDELRGRGYSFRGHSDTEVICAGLEEWGVADTVARLRGMFALAMWEVRARSLWLARDRMGIKPLYLHARLGYVSFGSELRALMAGPSFSREVDERAAAAMLRHLYVPAPLSIFKHTRKVMPGELVRISAPRPDAIEASVYWSLEATARDGASSRAQSEDTEAVDALERVLSESVTMHYEADVPVGAFLSGGIDSSVVVALLQRASASPVKTFSVAFDEGEHDESHFAAAVAKHLGTEHRELRLTAQHVLDLVPQMASVYDEPFADPSQLPSVLVCRAARDYVKVALSGDGGDELFAGYNRYRFGLTAISRLARVPANLRSMAGGLLTAVPTHRWDTFGMAARRAFPDSDGLRLLGQKAHKLGRLLRAGTPSDMYESLVSAWYPSSPMLRRESVGGGLHLSEGNAALSVPEQLLLHDQKGSLVDDQLTKIDRASMSASLEVRVPLLDHLVVEQSWRMPYSLKVRGGVSKYALRQVLYRHVPQTLIDRPKVGFSVPIAEWLRGPLAGWAQDVLDSASPSVDDLLDTRVVNRAWTALRRGDDTQGLPVWSALMLRTWGQRWMA